MNQLVCTHVPTLEGRKLELAGVNLGESALEGWVDFASMGKGVRVSRTLHDVTRNTTTTAVIHRGSVYRKVLRSFLSISPELIIC